MREETESRTRGPKFISLSRPSVLQSLPMVSLLGASAPQLHGQTFFLVPLGDVRGTVWGPQQLLNPRRWLCKWVPCSHPGGCKRPGRFPSLIPSPQPADPHWAGQARRSPRGPGSQSVAGVGVERRFGLHYHPYSSGVLELC